MGIPAKEHVDPNAKPWEQLPEESSQAWLAFSLYRDLGPSRMKGAALKMYNAQTGGRSKVPGANWHRWAKRFGWEYRIEAFDRANGNAPEPGPTFAPPAAPLRHADPLVLDRVQTFANEHAEEMVHLLFEIGRGNIEVKAPQIRAIEKALALAGIATSQDSPAVAARRSKRPKAASFDLGGMSTDDIVSLLEKLDK